MLQLAATAPSCRPACTMHFSAPAPHCCSIYSPDNDHVLSFVSSYLSTHSQSATQQQLLRLEPSGALGGSSSGPIELRTHARLWEVQWQELTILRLIGHGSYGSVYLAEWSQTQVAVKVLVGKGEHSAKGSVGAGMHTGWHAWHADTLGL